MTILLTEKRLQNVRHKQEKSILLSDMISSGGEHWHCVCVYWAEWEVSLPSWPTSLWSTRSGVEVCDSVCCNWNPHSVQRVMRKRRRKVIHTSETSICPSPCCSQDLRSRMMPDTKLQKTNENHYVLLMSGFPTRIKAREAPIHFFTSDTDISGDKNSKTQISGLLFGPELHDILDIWEQIMKQKTS